MPWRTILAVAGLLLSAQAASACSCLRSTRAEVIAKANVVFTGTVRAIRVAPDIHRHFATVSVTARTKGRVADTIVVSTGSETSLCGYPMQAGKTYRFAGTPNAQGQVPVMLCNMLVLNGER